MSELVAPVKATVPSDNTSIITVGLGGVSKVILKARFVANHYDILVSM